MKSLINNYIKIILITIIIYNIISISSYAQDDLIEPYLKLKYLKNNDGEKILTARLTYYENRQDIPIIDAEIGFNIQDSLITYIATDEDGDAILLISPEYILPRDDEGFCTFSAIFNGNDKFNETSSEELMLKDAYMELILEEIDSIKTITVKAYELDNDNNKIPISYEDVYIYVPRMFNQLRIGEEYFEEEGIISMEFPEDLPGDKEGNITIISKIEDNYTYGNVEVKKIVKWGIPSIHNIPPSHRALWTEIAPVWMIITLSIMLAGVWGHYIYTIIQLIFIKKDSKKISE